MAADFIKLTSAKHTPACLRIGLVAWNGLPAALPKSGTNIGGLETGAWELAKGLAQYTSCWPVFVVESPRPLPSTRVAGVDLHVSINRWKELRRDVSDCIDVSNGIRLKRLSWKLVWQVPLLGLSKPWRQPDPPALSSDRRLEDVDCDCWGCFGVNAESARVIATAMKQGRPSILFLESNADLDSDFQHNAAHINRYGVTATECHFCLQQCSVIVCQSNWQMHQLQVCFGKNGVLIRNPLRVADWEPTEEKVGKYVLWIGRYDDFHKRPLLALQIARQCPEVPFRMIVNRGSADIEGQVRENRPSNVVLQDYVPFDQMPGVYRDARLFLSTSSAAHEGFPNVVLQAAASQTPIVSLEDFDGFIRESAAGCCVVNDTAVSDTVEKDAIEGNTVVSQAVDRKISEAARAVRHFWSSGRVPEPARTRASLKPFELEHVCMTVESLALQLVELNAGSTGVVDAMQEQP